MMTSISSSIRFTTSNDINAEFPEQDYDQFNPLKATISAASALIKVLVKLEKQLYRHPLFRSFLIFRPVHSIFSFLCTLPFKLFYWFYIFPVVFFWSQLWNHVLDPTMKILCKRSELVNSMFEHVLALLDILQRIRLKMTASKWSDLLRFACVTLYEVCCSLLSLLMQHFICS